MNFPGLHFNTIIKAYLTIVNVLFTSEVGNLINLQLWVFIVLKLIVFGLEEMDISVVFKVIELKYSRTVRELSGRTLTN